MGNDGVREAERKGGPTGDERWRKERYEERDARIVSARSIRRRGSPQHLIGGEVVMTADGAAMAG